MEVVLVLCKKLLNQAVDLVDTGQLELIGAGQSHNFQNFLLENLLSINRFFSLVIVEGFKIGLKLSHEFPQLLPLLFGDSSILPPGLSFFVKLFNVFFKKFFVALAEVVVVSR